MLIVANVYAHKDLLGMIAQKLVRVVFALIINPSLACGSPIHVTRPARQPNSRCICDEGWEGINCNGNVIVYIYSKLVCSRDSVCDGFNQIGPNGTCYNSLVPVVQNYALCDVTSNYFY